jgi:hypothetical protein
MKANFIPLGLAAAVAAASAGYAGVVNATPTVANNGLGDLAMVPYYTTRGDFGTGVHVINTSPRTQVVKLRFRRGSDSLDAMDFNLIMSPYDEWTGFLSEDDSGLIAMSTQDTTCTSPLFSNGKFELSDLFRDGAEEGYIEVIGMGSPALDTETGKDNSPVSRFAKHAPGDKPANCAFVDMNFLDAYLGSAEDPRGVHSNFVTAGPDFDADGDVTIGVTTYESTDDVLKVSWFIRDSEQGLEFGNDAVHIAGFSDGAMITHQEGGKFSGNLRGFDFPDLNGATTFEDTTTPTWIAHGGLVPALTGLGWNSTVDFDKYNMLRAGDVLGVSAVLNDWSNNADLNVGTDWIITIPGQYTMLNQPKYYPTLGEPGGVIGGAVDENGDPIVCSAVDCDFRDLPVEARFRVWDREENLAIAPPGDRGTVISPSVPGAIEPTSLLRYEVNVVSWGEPILDTQYSEVDVSGLTELLAPAVSGWASLGIKSRTIPGVSAPLQYVCNWVGDYFNDPLNLPQGGPNYDPNQPMDCSQEATGNAPMIGFVAWQRSFPENPDGNYGRAVEHSFESGSINW